MEAENNYNEHNKSHIIFEEVRNFGLLIGAPFSFFRQEFKLLSKALLFFAAPFVVLGIILLGYLGNLVMDYKGSEQDLIIQIFMFVGGFLLMLTIGYSMVNSVVHNYTYLYTEKGKGNFTLEDIWNEVKKSSIKLFIQQFLIGLAVFTGFLFFYVPGIYLQTALSFVYIIHLKEKLSIWKAVQRSFEIIKDNWWITFLVVMLVGMILGFISYIILIPTYIIIFVGASMGEMSNVILYSGLVSFLLLFLFQIFAYAIQQLLVDFQYFNLVEEKESPALRERINAMKESLPTNNEAKFSFSNNPTVDNPDYSSFQPENTSNIESNEAPEDNFDRFKPK